MMGIEFTPPDFAGKHIELRCEDREVAIYATEEGLRKLAIFCQRLLDNPAEQHIHLEDYDVLTRGSLKGALALFRTERAPRKDGG